MSDMFDLPPLTAADLEALPKDAIVSIVKGVFGSAGDYARTSKGEFVTRLLNVSPETADTVRTEYERARAGIPAHRAAVAPVEAAQQLLSIVQSLSAGALDESRVRAIVEQRTADLLDTVDQTIQAALERIKPSVEYRPVIIRDGQDDKRIESHTHPLFDKVCKLVGSGLNVMLKGPAGCGKTKLAHDVAQALGLDFGAISGSAGASESQLLGWLLPVGEAGRFEYVASQFVTLYEQGRSLFLFDEMDAMDANMLIATNMATANGGLYVPQRHGAPYVKRGNGSALLAAVNTFGTGADAMYVGRNQLDAATLDRWYLVEMDYDKELERQLGSAQVCEWAWALREKAQAARLRRVVGTRTIQKAHAALQAGLHFDDVKRDLLTGWTKDELAKVGE